MTAKELLAGVDRLLKFEEIRKEVLLNLRKMIENGEIKSHKNIPKVSPLLDKDIEQIICQHFSVHCTTCSCKCTCPKEPVLLPYENHVFTCKRGNIHKLDDRMWKIYTERPSVYKD